MLAKVIIRITVLGLPKDIRQKYLRAWLAELEQINQETSKESLAFATSLFWNIPKMHKIRTQIKTQKYLPKRRIVGRLLLTGSTLAAVLIVLIQWSSFPTTTNQDKVKDALKLEENVSEPISKSVSELVELEEVLLEDDVSILESRQVPQEESEFLPFIDEAEIPAAPSASSSEGLVVVPPVTSDVSANGSLARATGLAEKPIPAPTVQNSPEPYEPYVRTPIAGYTSIEQESVVEEAFPEGAYIPTDLEADLEYKFDVDEQVLLAEESKQKEITLEESLRKLAQGYLVSKTVSEKEAAEFVGILGELLELDKKTTKNYLGNLLKQVP